MMGDCDFKKASVRREGVFLKAHSTRVSEAVCVVAVAMTLFLSACSKEPAEKEPIVPVQIAPVEKTTLQHTVTAEAVLFPLQQSAITPKVSAPVKTFYVTRGSPVHEGELLAVLEHQDLAAAAEDTKGSYDQAQAAYELSTGADLPAEMQKAQLETQAAKQLLDAQQKIYDSRQELFQQGALPRKELDQSGVDLTQARNQYEMAQKHLEALQAIGKQQTLKSAAGQLESAKGKYLGAQAQLSYSEIRSPINGVIADRPLYPGEMASAGTPLLTVMDVSRIIARAHIPEQEAALLKLGDKATITVPGIADGDASNPEKPNVDKSSADKSGDDKSSDDQPVEGKITVISPALDPNSTTVEIWVEAKNPRLRLKPGTSVQLSILARTIPDALVIPASSLLTAEDGSTSVMLAGSDNRAHQKTVKVGVRQGSQVQIVEGVQAGDHVVSSAAYGLPDNTRITVEAQNEPRAPERKSE